MPSHLSANTGLLSIGHGGRNSGEIQITIQQQSSYKKNSSKRSAK